MPRKKQERRGEKPQWRAREKTWKARVWEQDGTCSGWVDLGTDNQELAFKIYERWLLTGVKPEADRGKEKLAAAAERIVDEQAKTDPDVAKDRRARLRAYALPRIGMVDVARIEHHHVASVLDAMVKVDRKGAGTVLKMRSDLSQILAQLQREGAIVVNFAKSIAVHKDARVDNRERVGLTDEQILLFQKKRGFNTQLDMMCLFSRQVGGHRTSDEHAGVWEDVDQVAFSWMKVRRPKTDGEKGANARVGSRRTRAYEKVTHDIEEPFIRDAIRAYWVAQGCPAKGPIFPLLRDAVAAPMKLKDGRVIQRKGGKAGERRGKGTSHAKALRRAVWECGIYDPMPGFDPAQPDKALCRLQTDTDETRCLDFQSFRRALVTALADAKVSEADQLAITGHTQVTTQQRHYMGKRRVKVPRAALPGGAVEDAAPAAPALTAEQRAALELLLGRAPAAAANPPESTSTRDKIPGSGMKRAPAASAALSN